MLGVRKPLSAIAFVAFLAAVPAGAQAPAAAADIDELHRRLQACRGAECGPLREQMMVMLRDRLQECAGEECERLRASLDAHEKAQQSAIPQTADAEGGRLNDGEGGAVSAGPAPGEAGPGGPGGSGPGR